MSCIQTVPRAGGPRPQQANGLVTASTRGGMTWMAVTLCWLSLTTTAPLLAQAVSAQAPTGRDVAVIVNRENPLDSLSLAELRAILSGLRTYWRPGRPVALIVMPDPGAIERQIVLRVVLSMDEAAYRKHWVARVFRAESASAPISEGSPETIRRAVARIRGAIGIVPLQAAEPDVKVVRIDGKLPGDSSYPLR